MIRRLKSTAGRHVREPLWGRRGQGAAGREATVASQVRPYRPDARNTAQHRPSLLYLVSPSTAPLRRPHLPPPSPGHPEDDAESAVSMVEGLGADARFRRHQSLDPGGCGCALPHPPRSPPPAIAVAVVAATVAAATAAAATTCDRRRRRRHLRSPPTPPPPPPATVELRRQERAPYNPVAGRTLRADVPKPPRRRDTPRRPSHWEPFGLSKYPGRSRSMFLVPLYTRIFLSCLLLFVRSFVCLLVWTDGVRARSHAQVLRDGSFRCTC